MDNRIIVRKNKFINNKLWIAVIAVCSCLCSLSVSAAVLHNLISTKTVGISSIAPFVGVDGSGTRIVGFLGASTPIEQAASISVNVFPIIMFVIGVVLIFRMVLNKQYGNSTLVYMFLGIMLLISFLVILQSVVNAL